MRRFVARFEFSCNLKGNRPQSLTGHIVNVRSKRQKADNKSFLLNNEVAPWIISSEEFRKAGITAFYAIAQGPTTIFLQGNYASS